jgi:hypothetical protein
MDKLGRRTGGRERVEGQLRLPLCGLASAALWDAVVISGLALVEEELEEQRARVYVGRAMRSAGAPGAAEWARRRLAGAGRTTGEGATAAGTQHRGTGVEPAELVGVERVRSAR